VDKSQHGPLLMLAGGGLMAISTFINWRNDEAGLGNALFGLLGLLTLVFALAIIAVGAIRLADSDLKLPQSVAGFSVEQLVTIMAVAVLVPTFGSLSGERVNGGLHLAWLGAALAAAGGLLAARNSESMTTTRQI
jgi:hypothetical protein